MGINNNKIVLKDLISLHSTKFKLIIRMRLLAEIYFKFLKFSKSFNNNLLLDYLIREGSSVKY